MDENEVDMDKEFKRLSRKTNVNILRTEISYDNVLGKLDKDIDDAIDDKIKFFDDSHRLTSKHLLNDYSDSSLERYKKKLKNI